MCANYGDFGGFCWQVVVQPRHVRLNLGIFRPGFPGVPVQSTSYSCYFVLLRLALRGNGLGLYGMQ